MPVVLTLEGKVAFVTGSTRGIGWAVARRLASAGATVILNGVANLELLESRIHELEAEWGGTAAGFSGDVGDPATVKAWYAEIFRRFRRLDILVNNAGILQDALLGMIPAPMISRVINTNTAGAIYNLQEAARLMARHHSGSVINMSSIVGRFGNEGQSVYAASKAALIGLTLAAAKELAPKNVRVNAVAPGFIDTDMTQALPPAKCNERLAGIKMGRIGQPEDVAGAVLFLASDLSSYITGQVLGVDGGMLV